uniref:Conserved oligomeric Golgi complex subunit 8 n=1 Tax=Albugo laibachii Nc14 TaxID=890382 RepID=F0WHT3_9STRA|nr:conserved oligomeric Golgi complex subunit 8 putativ [Albugo laibachii Nc14]|eukprot:CCA20808.1 conserved oligomeric Golgi complex subunit 8 putativ [Albugo laibachii Nc14]
MSMQTAPHRIQSLDELRRAPWRLELVHEQKEADLKDYITKNYHLFIQSNQCSNVIKSEMSILQDQTNELIPKILSTQKTFSSTACNIAISIRKHNDIQFLLNHYQELQQLLEIPQSIHSCIQNELFESAIDLIQFFAYIFDMFSTSECEDNQNLSNSRHKIIRLLCDEVKYQTQFLRKMLVKKLSQDSPLVLCVRVVSLLRQLDPLVYSVNGSTEAIESKLKHEFLTSRSEWLNSVLHANALDDPYHHCLQVIDNNRSNWMNIFTQYTAIFGSREMDATLSRWASSNVVKFIKLLKLQLSQIDDFSLISNIMEQSLFFAGSFGRLGFDFRATLVVLFEEHVFDRVQKCWIRAVDDFREILNMHLVDAKDDSHGTNGVAKIVLSSLHLIHSEPSRGQRRRNDRTPPRQLLGFPILVEFTNAILCSLNNLRLCLITSLRTRHKKRFVQMMVDFAHGIADFSRRINSEESCNDETKRSKGSQDLNRAAESMIKVTESILIPYLYDCFTRLYPDHESNKCDSDTIPELECCFAVLKEITI